MGIFNEQSFDHHFARGIQGAPGVGFSLTSSGDYDMINKKLRNVGAPSANTDAATKKYVDDNSSGSPTTSRLTVDSDINMNNKYRITNLNPPLDLKDPATKYYVDNTFLDRDGSYPMKGNLNMANNRIFNLPAPNGGNQPTPLAFTDLKYVARDGSSTMTNNLNMDNKKIINLRPPTSNTDATTKKYVDDSIPDTSSFIKKDGSVSMTNNLNLGNKKIVGLATPTSNTDAATKKYVDDNTGAPDLSDYLEKDGTVAMTGDLNLNSHKIKNLSNPTQDNEAVTKNYVYKLVHHTAVQPSHYNDQFAYLMSSAGQWTDEIDTGTSFFVTRIGDLSPSKGNFHNYNHKVIFVTINKSSQGGYKYKMGINFYRLTANADYTLCLEILNTDYQLWHKSQITVDKGTSTGLSIGNVSVRKLSHRYSDSKGQAQFMYYHRIIVNFRKLSSGNKFFLHILANIPQDGTDLAVYPRQFSGVYMVSYGIVGTFSNIDSYKVYDYDTAFDIKPTEVVYKVDINANQKVIKNIKIDANDNSSAATIGQIKSMNNYTINNLYRQYFEEFHDFSDTTNYKQSTTSSGVSFNGVNPNFIFPTKNIDRIKEGGLLVNGYGCTITVSHSKNFTIGFVLKNPFSSPVLSLQPFRNFKLFSVVKNTNQKTQLDYNLRTSRINSTTNRGSTNITYSLLNKDKIVLWLTENSNFSITKESICNYSAKLNQASNAISNDRLQFGFTADAAILVKFMYSKNFYDFDSVQYHKIMIQEKLSGTYIE